MSIKLTHSINNRRMTIAERNAILAGLSLLEELVEHEAIKPSDLAMAKEILSDGNSVKPLTLKQIRDLSDRLNS